MCTDAPVPCLVGPTASGKSELGVRVARATRGEVISCDAFGVYRGMHVLAAAPDAPPDVPHHLVGTRSPAEPYSAEAFARDADRLVLEIRARRRVPWIVGGSALYLRGWLKGFDARVPRDPALRRRLAGVARRRGPARLHRWLGRIDPRRASEIHPNDERRLVRALEIVRTTGRPASRQRGAWQAPDRVRARLVGLRRSPEDLDRRIRERTRRMFEEGVLAEVAALREASPSPEACAVLGYDLLVQVLEGERAEDEARDELVRRTRRFARKQMTFLRSFDSLTWLDVGPGDDASALADRVLALVGTARA